MILLYHTSSVVYTPARSLYFVNFSKRRKNRASRSSFSVGSRRCVGIAPWYLLMIRICFVFIRFPVLVDVDLSTRLLYRTTPYFVHPKQVKSKKEPQTPVFESEALSATLQRVEGAHQADVVLV